MQNKQLIEKVKNKRLIFTVTTGRSGTAYLASILGYAKKVHNCHEPAPEYSMVLREAQNDPQIAVQFLLERKLPAIAEGSKSIYIETSHLVCKGFLEPILEFGLKPDLIIHRRPPRDVSLSLYNMGTIPGRSDKGLRFYLSPDDPGVLKLRGSQRLSDYQLCYWYCLEIERRAQVYKKMFEERGARVAETTLGGLKTIDKFENLLFDLDLSLTFPSWLTKLRFKRNTSVKVNESKETKKNREHPIDLDALEEEVVSLLEHTEWQDFFHKTIW
jgi:hypothetical protein